MRPPEKKKQTTGRANPNETRNPEPPQIEEETGRRLAEQQDRKVQGVEKKAQTAEEKEQEMEESLGRYRGTW